MVAILKDEGKGEMTENRTEQFVGEPQPQDQAVLWILWGAFTGSLFIYALVGYLIQQLSERPPVSELLSLLIPVFGGIALMAAILPFALGPTIAKQANYQAYSIIRWALAEAVGILGLMLFILGASWLIFAAFLGWALLLELRLRPTPDDREQFQRRKRPGENALA
jgi:hypothetical protein